MSYWTYTDGPDGAQIQSWDSIEDFEEWSDEYGNHLLSTTLYTEDEDGHTIALHEDDGYETEYYAFGYDEVSGGFDGSIESIDIPIEDADSYEDAMQQAKEYFAEEQGGDFNDAYEDYESDFMDAPDDAEDDEIPF